MPIKRQSNFIDTVVSIWDSRDEVGFEGPHWHEALELALIGELAILGIPPWYIREMLENDEKPGDDWIRYCISRVELDEDALEPLTVPDYEVCWLLLRVINHAKQTIKVESDQTTSPEYWLSIGVSLGLHSRLIGREKDHEILIRLRNADAGKGNLGTTRSPSSDALRYAVEKGYTTGGVAWNFFLSVKDIPEKGIEVLHKRDRYGHPEALKFIDKKTKKSSEWIKPKSLSTMISRFR